MVSPSYSTASMLAVWLLKNCWVASRRDSNREVVLAVSTAKPSAPRMGRSPFRTLLVLYGSRRLSGWPSESMIRQRSTGMEPGRGEAEGVGSRVGSQSAACRRSGGPSPGRWRWAAVLSGGQPELGSASTAIDCIVAASEIQASRSVSATLIATAGPAAGACQNGPGSGGETG